MSRFSALLNGKESGGTYKNEVKVTNCCTGMCFESRKRDETV